MRILNIIQRYPPSVGGSETWCREICSHLARCGDEVRVLTMDVDREEEYWREPQLESRTSVMGRFALDDGIEVRRYHRSLPIHSVYHGIYKRVLDNLFNLYFYGPHSIEMYGRMWREIRRTDLIVLHTIPYPHNFIGYCLGRAFGKRIAIVPHFHPDHPHYERPSNYWLLRNCDVILTVSEFEREYLQARGVPPEKLHVTGNGIHPEKYMPTKLEEFRAHLMRTHGLTAQDRVVTFVGRKLEDKGVGYLIEAVRSLRRDMPLKLFLAGPGFDWFDEYYKSLTPDERKFVIDLGVLSHQDKVNLLHMTDLLVLPSKYEAFGIVFLEAWICGAPVLGTDRGAMPEIIADAGWVCEFGSAGDLGEKIAASLNDPAQRQQCAIAGKAKVLGGYTWKQSDQGRRRHLLRAGIVSGS
jgi:glycosyltransferase involved in cell wall biosynthesis